MEGLALPDNADCVSMSRAVKHVMLAWVSLSVWRTSVLLLLLPLTYWRPAAPASMTIKHWPVCVPSGVGFLGPI